MLTLNIDQPAVRTTCDTNGHASCAQAGTDSVMGSRAMPTTVVKPPINMIVRVPKRVPRAPLGRPIPM